MKTVIIFTTNSFLGVYELVAAGFVPVLLENLIDEEEEIIVVHLKALERLLQAEGKISALENEAFGILVSEKDYLVATYKKEYWSR